MTPLDNGGANAIKGFNYQKSVIILIAVLNYLNKSEFEISVESEDDIVVTVGKSKTFMQVKSKPLSIATILREEKGKDGKPKSSILEKNTANGNETDSMFKIVTPSFAKESKHLESISASFLTDGATLYAYSEEGIDKINEINSRLSKQKIKNSKVAITDFGANQTKSWTYIKGVMVNQGIPVDRGAGMASLNELSRQIDERSELVVNNEDDLKKKVFNRKNLQNIFNNSRTLEIFDELISALDYSTAMKVEMRNKNKTIGAIYESYINAAKEAIGGMEYLIFSDRKVIDEVLDSVSFGMDVSAIDRETIAVNAYSQILFEREQ